MLSHNGIIADRLYKTLTRLAEMAESRVAVAHGPFRVAVQPALDGMDYGETRGRVVRQSVPVASAPPLASSQGKTRRHPAAQVASGQGTAVMGR